jgi:hypothetical protein
MKKPVVRFAIVSVAAATLVLMTVVVMPALGARQQPIAPDDLISGPTEWVPLTYEWEDRVNGVVNDVYVEYRGANGSTRRERRDGVVQIANIPSQRYFVFEHGAWRQHPLRPQKGNGKPFAKLLRSDVKQVPPTDPRVQLIVRFVGSPLTFYELPIRAVSSTADQVIGSSIFSPELNMLEVWQRHERPDHDGVAEKVVTNIVLGEPAIEWVPPSDARVAVEQQPAGPGRGTPSQTRPN